ncbi:MAG: hypothetical protein ACE15C_12235 [Phycisphaerae bacterium]
MGRTIKLAILFLLAASVSQAEAADQLFNVDVGFGWGGCYRPLQWTPMEITIHAPKLKEPLGGVVQIAAQQDSMTSMTVSQPVVVTADLPCRAPLVTKFAAGGNTASLALLDDKGRTKWSQDYSMGGYTPERLTKAVSAKDMLIGVAGRMSFGLSQLGQQSTCATGDGQGSVFVRDKQLQLLPLDWTGYASLDALVLCNPDWGLINVHQGKAISQWVSSGGKLLIVLGGNPLPADHPVASLLPFKLGAFKPAKLPANRMPRRPPNLNAVYDINIWGIGDAAAGGCKVQNLGGEQVLAQGPVGFGQVAVLAFDPSEIKERETDEPTRAAFWCWCLDSLPNARRIQFRQDRTPSDDSNDYGERFEAGVIASATNAVIKHLYDIGELRVISIWWVILLLAVLAVLLGPIDYLVLKRLDKLPLTWITSAVIIAGFTVAAYYGVRAIRGGSMHVRAVTVIDAVAGDSASAAPAAAWATSFCGIAAQESDEYSLMAADGNPLGGNQWWSAVSAARDEYDYSDSRIASRRIAYLQQGPIVQSGATAPRQEGGNIPTGVPINIWSMQVMLDEARVGEPPITAEVATDGRAVTLTVTNKSTVAIKDAYLRLNNLSVSLGAIAPGQTSQFKYPNIRAAANDARPQSLDSSPVNAAQSARGVAGRTAAVESYLKQGAAVIYAAFEQAPLPCSVAGRSYATNHVQIARLVIPAKSFKRME